LSKNGEINKTSQAFCLVNRIDILLLFGQAMADLALPGYMADIVNVRCRAKRHREGGS